MAITIKQRAEVWRLIISEEEWEFNNRADLEKALKTLLDMKTTRGNLKKPIFQTLTKEEFDGRRRR